MKIEKCLSDLQLEVIYNDKCIKCGSCGAFCPNIYFEEGEMKYTEQCSETVGVCYNFCPRGELDIPALDMKIFGEKRQNQAIGVFKKAVNARLNDGSLQDVATALLVQALEEGIIDSAVLGDAKVEKRIEPVICKSKDEIVANAGERRGFGPIVGKVGEAISKGSKKIGVLGRPCHGQGLAKIIKNRDFLVQQDRIKLVISQFCLAQGKACAHCLDYTGEFSDLSLSQKNGDLIIRSSVGEDLVNKAVASGKISVTDIGISAIEETATKKKVKNFLKILAKSKGMVEADYLKLDVDNLKGLTQ
ncbi:MAG: Coenzyme F420 hydrogenase/dehydrogenase, beta subunit C-terminal domain [Promethearchaeota archaeon]